MLKCTLCVSICYDKMMKNLEGKDFMEYKEIAVLAQKLKDSIAKVIVGKEEQAELWDLAEYNAFEQEALAPEKLLASLEAIGL